MNGRGYKLKDFSRITNLTRKALLLYEKKGLLIPDIIDERTGYRYYSAAQLKKASILAFLRNLDIPLNDLPGLIDGTQKPADYFHSIGKRQALLRQQIKIGHALQAIQLCENTDCFFCPQTEVTMLPQIPIISIEGTGGHENISTLFSVMKKFLSHHAIRNSGSFFAYFFQDSTPEKLHFKAAIPVDNMSSVLHHDIRSELFPATKVASLRHFGDHSTCNLTYAFLDSAIQERGWGVTGECVETYLLYGDRKHTDSSSFVTILARVLE